MRKLLALTVGLASIVFSSTAQAATTPSLSTVLSHTHAANIALQTAVSEFDAHALGAGSRAFKTNRNQLGIAVMQTAQLIQAATTPAARLVAAKAVVAIARQAGRDETAFAKVARVLRRGGMLQLAVIRAAARDTARTTTAVSHLTELLSQVPAAALPGLTIALAHVTLAHGLAVTQLGRDAASARIGRTAKGIAAADANAEVHGQAHAINLLQALEPLLPAAARTGIQTALAAIASSLSQQASTLAADRATAPLALRPTLAAAIRAARAAAADASS